MKVTIVRWPGGRQTVMLKGSYGPGRYVMTLELYQSEVRPRVVASGQTLEEERRPATREELEELVRVMETLQDGQ